MDAWKNAFFLQEKPMSIKFLVLGGGVFGVWGGGECRFYFYGRADFSDNFVEPGTPLFHDPGHCNLGGQGGRQGREPNCRKQTKTSQ